MAEAKGHADHQFPRVPDEAVYCSSFVLVHARPRRIPPGVCPKVLASESTSATVSNEIVIEAMIKGLRPGPTAQYFARKPPHTLEKLLQKMDEYILADNDFHQRREEAYRFSVAEPPKLLGPHAHVLVPRTSNGYACAQNNLTGSV